jgi:hypothetical protein
MRPGAIFMKRVAVGSALFAGLTCGAMAAPVTFSWSPAGASNSMNGGNIVGANGYGVSDYASITLGPGTFTEQGALKVLAFANGGSTVASTGLNGTYSLYLTFNATGTFTGIPTTNGQSLPGTFTGLTYQLVGTTSGSPPLSFTVTNGSVAVNDTGTHVVLADGALVPGTGFVTLTKTSGGFSPTANLNLTFNQCLAAGQDGVCTANEAGFFLSPITGLQLQVGNFSASDSVTQVVTDPSGTTFINIGGNADSAPGGGNLTFEPRATPEPASVAMLGMGLLGLGAAYKRKRHR